MPLEFDYWRCELTGWVERRRKGDPEKLEIAARLRRETTLTIKAIAARVWLGTSKAANSRLHGFMRDGVCGSPVRKQPRR